MKSRLFTYLALLLGVLGFLIVFGILAPFPSSTVCVGALILGQCIGYYSTKSNGNNFVLGVVLIGAAALVYFLGKRRGR